MRNLRRGTSLKRWSEPTRTPPRISTFTPLLADPPGPCQSPHFGIAGTASAICTGTLHQPPHSRAWEPAPEPPSNSFRSSPEPQHRISHLNVWGNSIQEPSGYLHLGTLQEPGQLSPHSISRRNPLKAQPSEVRNAKR